MDTKRETVLKSLKQQDLAIALQQLEEVPHRLAELEQYSTPAEVAADLLWIAMNKGDIQGKRVADLGCGNGVLGIGAGLLGAASVHAVDIDSSCVRTAMENASRAGVPLETTVADVVTVEGEFDTVIQNPPFGAQRRHADLPFLMKGIALAPALYTLHNAPTTRWVERTVDRLGGTVDLSKRYKIRLPYQMPFQKKSVHHVDVVLFRILRS